MPPPFAAKGQLPKVNSGARMAGRYSKSERRCLGRLP